MAGLGETDVPRAWWRIRVGERYPGRPERYRSVPMDAHGPDERYCRGLAPQFRRTGLFAAKDATRSLSNGRTIRLVYHTLPKYLNESLDHVGIELPSALLLDDPERITDR